MQRQRWRDQSGSVLVWVMVVGLFAVGALGAVTRLLPAGTHLAERDKDTTYALITAESGVNFVAHYLRENPGASLADLRRAVADADFELDSGTFDIAADDEFVYVRAHSGDATRNLRARLDGDREPPEPPINLTNAIFATYDGGHAGDRAVNLSPSPAIYGSVGTNSSGMGAFHIGGDHTITGSIYLGPGSRADTIQRPNWLTIRAPVEELPEHLVFQLPEFPEYPDPPYKGSVTIYSDDRSMDISESGRYDAITVARGGRLVFDTGGRDIYVRVHTITVDGEGKVEVVGGGRLFLYVDEYLRLTGGGHSFHLGGDPGSVAVFYRGSEDFSLAGNFKFTGTIYVKDSAVNLGGSGHIRGNLVAGGPSVKISGGGSGVDGLLYAPEADVTLSGSGMSGAVVGRRISMSGGAVSHAAIDLGSIPLDFADDEEYDPAEDGLVWHVCWGDMGCDAETFEGFD